MLFLSLSYRCCCRETVYISRAIYFLSTYLLGPKTSPLSRVRIFTWRYFFFFLLKKFCSLVVAVEFDFFFLFGGSVYMNEGIVVVMVLHSIDDVKNDMMSLLMSYACSW